MKTALAAIGFTATIAQVALMREMIAVFYGNELLFGLVLTAWLAWVAIGSWSLGRLERVRQGERKIFAAGLVLAVMLFPAQLGLVRGIRALLGVTPGALVEFGAMLVAVAASVAPLCLLLGGLFTVGARLITEQGGTPGQAYVWESAGSVIGGALFSFLFIRWLDPFQTALLVGAINASVALWLWQSVTPKLKLSLFSLLALSLAAIPAGSALHAITLHWQWRDLVFAGDSPYGRLTIQARDGQRIFYTNGMLAFETQGTFSEQVTHLPLLAHPDPRDILLIGGGVAGDLREILKHPVASVTYVELDPLLIEAALQYLPSGDAITLKDPRVTLLMSDGRLFVKNTQRAFDVVILDLPEPATGALNRFYTVEFFAQIRAILQPGGVFALNLPSAENYWSPELARRNASIYRTLQTIFPQVLVLPGEHDFFLASDQPLAADPSILIARLTARNIRTRWVTPRYIEYVFTSDRFAGVQRALESAAGVRVNQDLYPICYYYDLALWLSRFYPNLRGFFEGASLVNLLWVAVPLILIATLVRWRRAWVVPSAIAGIGFAQMMLEMVLLFAFQVLHGYVYAEVSLIVTAFMLGLVLGSAASNRVLSLPRGTWANAKQALIAVLGALIIYSGALGFVFSLGMSVPALIFLLLALLAGCLGGMTFPLAVTLVQGEPGSVVGTLYAADLIGGCLGALLGAVFLVPVLGVPQTCAIIVLVGLAGLAILCCFA